MTATMVFQNMFMLVDMFFVGKLGPVAIAAVGTSMALLGVVHMLALGVTTGCTAFVTRAIGAGDRDGAERAAAQSLLMGLGLSAIIAATGVPLAGRLLGLLHAAPEVIEAGRPYMQIMCGGSAAMILSFVFGSVLRGAGDARTPLVMVVLGNVVNVALDPVLIFGLLGAPRLGVAGSAWATVLSRAAVTLVLAWVFFVRGHSHFHLGLAALRPDLATIAGILRIGVFGSGQMLIRNVSALVLMRIVTMFGTVAVAAYTVGLRLWFMVLMLGMGVGSAAATLVGQNLGAGRPHRAAQAGWLIAAMYAAVCAAFSVGFCLWAEDLISVFNDDPEVVATGAQLLRWVAPTFVFLAFSVVLGNAMNGAGDTLMPLVVVALAVLVLRLPLALVLSINWDSVSGVWAALAVSSVCQGLLYSGAFWWGRWRRMIPPGASRAAGQLATEEGLPSEPVARPQRGPSE
jgi:putative MATE family efflux protein